MLQSRGEANLALEPLRPERGRELRMEHLERDGAAVLQVSGEEVGGHPASTQLALDRVSVGQCSRELAPEVWHQVPATSFWNRWFFRSGSNVGSILSHAGVRSYGILSNGSS